MARAVFSDQPEGISARLFAEVLRRLFLGDPSAASLAHARYGLSDTYAEPAARYLARMGSQVLRGRTVRSVRRLHGGYEIGFADGPPLQSRSLCVAITAPRARAVLGADLTASCPGLEDAADFPQAPIVSVNLWLADGPPVLPEPFVGLVDGEFSWFFDRGTLTEDAGGERHVVLIAPGARRLLTLPATAIVDLAMDTLQGFCGLDLRGQLRETRVVKEPHAAPSLTPEVERLRPGPETGAPGLTLAGDWTRTGLPATLESAAASGHRAAGVLHAFLRRPA
jgi:hypothetical protein